MQMANIDIQIHVILKINLLDKILWIPVIMEWG